MHKSFRYRIYPTKSQVVVLEQHLAICAELYNAAIEERRSAWKVERSSITWFDQNLQLKDVRQERPDVAAVNARVLEATLKRADLAFRAFFRRLKSGEKAGYPRFRSPQSYDSMTFRQDGARAPRGNKLRVSKIGQVRIKYHRPLEGVIKTLTIRRCAGRWFAVFSCEVEAKPLPFSPNVIGIDVGLTHFATLSDGSVIDNPRYYDAGAARLRVAQRRIARRDMNSNRRRKAVVLFQRAHAQVRAQRADFHHKESRKIVNLNGLIAVEDLNVAALARSWLRKSVVDAGWTSFINKLAYKAEDAGRLLIKVDPRGTSQTCVCGAEVRKTLSQRWHLCSSCGLSASRDHVSAQVILGRAARLQDSTWAAAPRVS